MVRTCTAIACLALLVASAGRAAEAARIDVTILNHPAYPALSGPKLAAALEETRRIVRDVCGLELAFDVHEPRDLDAFLDEQEKRIAPYTASELDRWDPFQTPPQTHRKDIGEICRRFDNLAALRILLRPQQVADEDAAAEALTQRFLSTLEQLRRARNVHGPLLTPDGWRRLSYTHWYTLLHSAPWTESNRLVLTNTILLDDSRTAPAIGARASGGLSTGFVLPASRTVVVACGSMLGADLPSSVPQIELRTDADRQALLAYLIAQRLGPYLLMEIGPIHDQSGGLARPPFLLSDMRDLTDVQRMKLPPGREPHPSGYLSFRSKLLLRMDVLLVQQRWKEVLAEGQKAVAAARLSEGDMVHVQARLAAARRELGE